MGKAHVLVMRRSRTSLFLESLVRFDVGNYLVKVE